MSELSAQRSRSCRAHAEQCRARADLSKHLAMKDAFLAAAEGWEKIATQIEEIDQLGEYTRNTSRLVPPPGQDKVD